MRGWEIGSEVSPKLLEWEERGDWEKMRGREVGIEVSPDLPKEKKRGLTITIPRNMMYSIKGGIIWTVN